MTPHNETHASGDHEAESARIAVLCFTDLDEQMT